MKEDITMVLNAIFFRSKGVFMTSLRNTVLYQKKRNLGALFFLVFPGLMFIHPVVTEAAFRSGTNDTNAAYTQAFQWVSTGIDIAGAPPEAEITSVDINWNIDGHFFGLIDVEWYLGNSTGYSSAIDVSGMAANGNDPGDGHNDTSEKGSTLFPPAGTEVNGTWTFSIQDGFDDGDPVFDSGRIDSWDILITYTCATMPFLDAPAWAEDFIKEIYCQGITTGCAADQYCPGQDVTRAQMAVFVVRGVEGDGAPVCTSAPFPDIPANHWACRHIKRANELGIVSGFPDGTYGPSVIVTRAQMAVFIIRGMVAAGIIGAEPPDGYCTSDPFPDVPASHWACKYIKRANELGIVFGFPDGTYGPGVRVTRAQMAVFIARAFLGM